MREIVLDTETTGINPAEHRLVEIGCIELFNHVPTGKTFHQYINPERDIPEEAVNVHGLTAAFLSDKPVFAKIADEFLEFIGDAPLIIHNADFDMGFINAELSNVGHARLPKNRAVDTLRMARQRFPGSPASLDALCRRFGIDNSHREYHGALLDSELLAEVYVELLGGKQRGFDLAAQKQGMVMQEVVRTYREPRPFSANTDEVAAHQSMLGKIKNALWLTPNI